MREIAAGGRYKRIGQQLHQAAHFHAVNDDEKPYEKENRDPLHIGESAVDIFTLLF